MKEVTIYKLDSKSKLRFLTISTEGSEVVQTSGLVGTDSPVTNRSQCIGKNIGKVNETTAEEQAILEAQSKLKKKLEEGYYETQEEAEDGILILPMLAHDMKKHESKVNYPCFVSPKLDGMRCLKNASKMISRKNKPIETMRHIAKELSGLNIILDGELYAENENFQRNMELIKKYRQGESEQVKYHVYDIVDSSLSFKQRYEKLKEILYQYNPENIVLVPAYEINSKEELLEYHRGFLEQGYEGSMIRHSDIGYEVNKRSYSLLKFKDFQDIACKIVDVEASEKRPDQGIFICELEDGRTFGCGMRFSHEERAEFLTNKDNYIGQTAEVRFFEYSNDGIPRFPVVVGFRLDL